MSTEVMPTPDPASPEGAEGGFVRGLGLWDATMIVAGSMIGSGIFIVSADIARQVGSPGWLLVVWLITGLLTLMAALSYGELAAMMPKAGGQYVYLREAYGPVFGFLYGWTLFMVIQTGTIAAVAVAFAKFLGVLTPAVSADRHLLELGAFAISTQQGVGLAVRKYTMMKRGILSHDAQRKPGSTLSAAAKAEVDYLLARIAKHDPRAKL